MVSYGVTLFLRKKRELDYPSFLGQRTLPLARFSRVLFTFLGLGTLVDTKKKHPVSIEILLVLRETNASSWQKLQEEFIRKWGWATHRWRCWAPAVGQQEDIMSERLMCWLPPAGGVLGLHIMHGVLFLALTWKSTTSMLKNRNTDGLGTWVSR